jgi:ATP-dependent DNA ligase
MRARHSASSAQIRFTQESREAAATTPAGHRSASLRGFAEAVKRIVSKPRDRPYQGGRSREWVKVKNRKHPALERVMA